MRKILLMCAALFLVFGCAKKQMIKPVVETPQEAVEETKDEASVRFSDWTEIEQVEPIRFEYDRFELTAEGRKTLQKNAEYLKGSPDMKVLVEGHCDERGTIEYNLALGQKRAAAVRSYYGKLGVALSSIGTISFGSEKPMDMGHNEAAWALNRRAETKIRNK